MVEVKLWSLLPVVWCSAADRGLAVVTAESKRWFLSCIFDQLLPAAGEIFFPFQAEKDFLFPAADAARAEQLACEVAQLNVVGSAFEAALFFL